MPGGDERSDGEGGRHTHRRRGFLRRHRALLVLVCLPLLLLVPVGGWLLHLDAQMSEIPRFDADLDRSDRPPRAEGAAGEATNIVLAGVDDGQGTALQDALRADSWPSGVFRSDTIMVLHLSADGSRAQLISIPRDSWVPVPGHGRTKINAAFSYGGPGLLVHTIEDLTNLRIDHVVAVDWAGFDGLTEVVGGVDVTGDRGETVHLEGAAALEYVRERKSLPRGDFSRIQRQQNFLRAVLRKVTRIGVLRSPLELTNLVEESSEFLAVDDTLDNGDLRGLARSHRGLRAGDMDFLTIPTRGTGREGGASIVRVDRADVRALFTAVATDDFDAWYDRQPQVDELPAEVRVP